MSEHTAHVTIVGAYWPDCWEGECHHRDEDGEPQDFSVCPTVPPFEVCVDCMDAEDHARDPKRWDDVPLTPWPCETTGRQDRSRDD